MAEDVYRIAVRRANRLRAELARLDGFLATYEELASSQSEAATASTDPTGLAELAAPTDEAAPAKGVPQAEIERVAARILLEHGTPLKRQALFEKVKSIGTMIGGQDELANFGTKISRSSKFVNLPKLGYWPKDKPYEAAGYRPGGAQ